MIKGTRITGVNLIVTFYLIHGFHLSTFHISFLIQFSSCNFSSFKLHLRNESSKNFILRISSFNFHLSVFSSSKFYPLLFIIEFYLCYFFLLVHPIAWFIQFNLICWLFCFRIFLFCFVFCFPFIYYPIELNFILTKWLLLFLL